tara:strand:+ start:71 stop:478 length:408 start_codon:yes stop_codon:yes gene_type:complete
MLHLKNVKTIVVHCSDTPDNEFIGAREIHKMHLSFGWDGIGYHKVILRDGVIENGRPEFWIGAHVKGKNSSSLGVCLIGRENFTNDQFFSLEKIINIWKEKYFNVEIMGHRDVVKTSKTCPNFDVKKWCLNRGIV